MALMTTLLLAGVTVSLPMEADVHGTEILLGDVATISGEDAAEVSAVEGLSLGYAPAPGYSRLLQRHRLEQLVDRKLPDVVIAFRGEPACRVHGLNDICLGLLVNSPFGCSETGQKLGLDEYWRDAHRFASGRA